MYIVHCKLFIVHCTLYIIAKLLTAHQVTSKWMNNKLVTVAEGRKTVTVTRELRGEFMITTMKCKNATSRCIFSRDTKSK